MTYAGDLVGGFLGTITPLPKEIASPETSVQVCVRIRPILRNEKEVKDTYAWNWEGKTLYPHIAGQLPYSFDHLFFPESTNEDIFEEVVKKVVLQSMNGYNGSIFTYGQTSSGKTFTMNGSHTQPGIIPQAIYYCFKSIQDSFPDREFLFRVSYIEVYNEQVKDLLNSEPCHIKIQHDPKNGTKLSGVKEQVVLSPQQVIALIRAGEAQRHVGSTDMNETSSRAHTLFKLIIESRQRGDSSDSPVRASFLNLIDLAGSENAKMTSSTGVRATEAKHINQSLLTLSLIIQRLSEEKAGAAKKAHFPFRDSKLTRLLQSSLSGNAKIAVICTVSPTLRCVDETHNTLRFATRAKRIKTNASVNEVMDDKTLLKAYKMEISTLRARLSAMEKNQAPSPFLQIMEGARESGRNVEDMDFNIDDNEIESEGLILQMISEMERLILKADVVGDSPESKKPLISKKTYGQSPPSNMAFGSKVEPSTTKISSLSSSTSSMNNGRKPPISSNMNRLSTGGTPTARTSTGKPVLKSPMSETSAITNAWRENMNMSTEPTADRDSETTKESISAGCSDNTSIDDYFDGTTNTDLGDENGKNTPLGRDSFLHNQYMLRPEGLESMTEEEYMNALDPTDDCKSAHPVAKEYIKAIHIVKTPTRGSLKSVAGSSSREGKKGVIPRATSLSLAVAREPLRRGSSASSSASMTASRTVGRKFGFVPSPTLTQSLSVVARDAERASNGHNSISRRSSAMLSSRDFRDSDTTSDISKCDTSSQRRSSIRRDASKSESTEPQNHHVLFDVSQMLFMLKKHVEKSG